MYDTVRDNKIICRHHVNNEPGKREFLIAKQNIDCIMNEIADDAGKNQKQRFFPCRFSAPESSVSGNNEKQIRTLHEEGTQDHKKRLRFPERFQ